MLTESADQDMVSRFLEENGRVVRLLLTGLRITGDKIDIITKMKFLSVNTYEEKPDANGIKWMWKS